MTKEEAIEKIKKSMECHDRKVCGLAETCEECPLYVDKDTEYEAHKVLIKALSQEPQKNTLDELFKNIKKWEEEAEQEPCDDKRLFIKIYADYEPSVVAEKVYQICDEDEFPEVVSRLNAYLEPCDDAISREDALNGVDAMYNNSWDLRDFRQNVDLMLKELPSVTPSRRKGHWEFYGRLLKCSECGKIWDDMEKECLKCGVKMEIEE